MQALGGHSRTLSGADGCGGTRPCSAFASPGTGQTSGTDADIRSPSLQRTDLQREAHPDTPTSSDRTGPALHQWVSWVGWQLTRRPVPGQAGAEGGKWWPRARMMTGRGAQGDHIAFGDFQPSSDTPALLSPGKWRGVFKGRPHSWPAWPPYCAPHCPWHHPSPTNLRVNLSAPQGPPKAFRPAQCRKHSPSCQGPH